MKKLTLLTLSLLCICIAYAQYSSPRMVLLEHFTQASCGPCAIYNPDVNTLLDNHPDKIIAIKYQTSWPGYDPMNDHNPTDVADRVAYYGVQGVPNSVLDGNYFNDHPANWNLDSVTNRKAVNSPFTINLQHTISNTGEISVTMDVTASDSISGNLVAHIAVIEEYVEFEDAPGSNGEKEFEDVMKKMLPSGQGTSLPTSFTPTQTQNITETWQLSNIYDYTQIAVVAFVQDKTTKEVYQAAYSAPNIDLKMNMATSSFQTIITDPGTTVSFSGNFDVPQAVSSPSDYVIALNKSQLPAGWNASLGISGTAYPNSATLSMSAGGSEAFTISVSAPPTADHEKAIITIVGKSSNDYPFYTVEKTFTVVAGVDNLLIEKDNSYTNVMTDAFTGSGLKVAILSSGEFKKLDFSTYIPSSIENTFINTGSLYSSIFDQAEVTELESYLNAGGNIAFIGQDLGYFVADAQGNGGFMRNFYTTYIGAQYLSDGDDTGLPIAGVASDQFYGSLAGGTVLNTSTFTLYSDHIRPTGANSKAIFYYNNDSTDVAGVRNNGSNWKTMYLGCRFEVLNDAAFRGGVIGGTIMWFNSVLSSAELDELIRNLSVGQNYPNPVTGMTTIPLENLTKAGTLEVVNINGQTVMTVPVRAAMTEIEVNASKLETGIYLYRLSIEGQPTKAMMMQVIK